MKLFSFILFTALSATYFTYYTKFVQHKPASFETDRMRGHEEFSTWLQANFDPLFTLVVLNDGITCSPAALMFNSFDKPFRFVILQNYSDPFDLWKQAKAKGYEKIVLLLPYNDGKAKPDWHFDYDGRRLLNAYSVNL